MPLRINTILVHYGEIALKGQNRPDFLRCLKENLEKKLGYLGKDWRVFQPYGYLYIEVPEERKDPIEPVLEGTSELAGVVWYARAHHISPEEAGFGSEHPNRNLIQEKMIELAKDHFVPNRSFRVRANRGYKEFAFNTPELQRWLGREIIEHTGWQEVQLKEPDQVFYIDVQREGIFLFAERLEGMGGLPTGITGKVLALLSGGIDSPVAAYLAAKRGCSVDFIHFTATHLQQSQAQDYKVSDLVRMLSKTTLYSRLYLVPYTHFEFSILGKQVDYELMIFRRFMARTGEYLAMRIGAQALVTGDNLAQVASQTLENIVSNSKAVSIPIIRPLITYDKREIVDLARRIGTFQISLQPYKDCCSILKRHPRTKSEHQAISELEDSFLSNQEEVIRNTLEDAICLEYEYGEEVTEKVQTSM